MAATLEARISLEIQLALLEGVDLGTRKFEPLIKKLQSLGSGVGLNQADRVFVDTRSLAGSATEDLDVAASGGLLDAFGAAFALVKLKGLYVMAAAGNLNLLNVTRSAANGVPWALAAGDGVALAAGGFLAFSRPDLAAITVTAATGDLITFTNAAATNTISYDVVIIGASA